MSDNENKILWVEFEEFKKKLEILIREWYFKASISSQ